VPRFTPQHPLAGLDAQLTGAFTRCSRWGSSVSPLLATRGTFGAAAPCGGVLRRGERQYALIAAALRQRNRETTYYPRSLVVRRLHRTNQLHGSRRPRRSSSARHGLEPRAAGGRSRLGLRLHPIAQSAPKTGGNITTGSSSTFESCSRRRSRAEASTRPTHCRTPGLGPFGDA
jgi:hypothetical protein